MVALDGYTLASRLSFFLWNSAPDPELLAAAASGALATPAGLNAEVRRLLAHPHAARTREDFHRGWLHLDDLDAITRDAPELTPALARDLRRSALLGIEDVYQNGARVERLFLAPTLFESGAIESVYGLRPAERRGLLTHPALLALLANPDASDPIQRGLFIEEKVLCQPTPAPIDDVPQLPPLRPGLSTRARLEQHRAHPACAACHRLFDPVGLAFEHYDAIGRYRTTDQGVPVDASGEIDQGLDIDGRFADGRELIDRLAASGTVRSCLTRHWFEYAVSRLLEPADRCALDPDRSGVPGERRPDRASGRGRPERGLPIPEAGGIEKMAFAKRLDLSRRALLTRLGPAALALPALQAFRERAWAQGGAPRRARNFLMITTPNGVDPPEFWPTGGERDFTLSPNLAPLERHRDRLIIVGPQFASPDSRQPIANSGLRFAKTPGIHRAWVATTCHSATAPRTPQTGDGLTVRTAHPSVDQLIASKLGARTRFPSLELGVHPVGGDVPCIVNFSLDGSPMPRMASDSAAFERIFGGLVAPPAASPAGAPDLARPRRAAVSDLLAGRFAALGRSLGREDRQLLDSHLQSLREVEARVVAPTVAPTGNVAAALASFAPATLADPSNPTSDAPALTANMQDLVALAFASDLTRVASISMSWEGGGGSGGLVHTWLGFRNAHHGMSHHGGNPDKRAKYNRITNWYASQIARMLDQLQRYPHPDGGTLYDQTLVWWMFRHGDGNAHANFAVPAILAGGAGGHFGPLPRYLNLPSTSYAHLPFSLVTAMGIPIDAFGIADNRVTAPLPGLHV